MTDISTMQIRSYRLHSHHLDAEYQKTDITTVAGACGLQNSPPGSWEVSLFNRVPGCSKAEMESLLYQEKSLIQAWSLRGAPVVFPAAESDVYLSALIARGDEPWIYTKGIRLALEFLQMSFDDLLEILKAVIHRLDGMTIVSKNSLDQTLAEWMLPLLPAGKRELWNQPSMYGSPEKQTVGGAVVSFLLRPCAFSGLVVFGERKGISPAFTSYNSWTGYPLETAHLLASGERNETETCRKLVRKFLHCYGPATVDLFISWLGCSGKQGRRMWDTVKEEIEPVIVSGRKAYILSEDRDRLFMLPSFTRELLLLGGHDPYLDQRDRFILQPDKALHSHIWKTVTNPGAIVYCGEIIGIWTGKKRSRGLEINMTLWKDIPGRDKLGQLAERYAAFRQQKLLNIGMSDL